MTPQVGAGEACVTAVSAVEWWAPDLRVRWSCGHAPAASSWQVGARS